jgi:hypothetical protein
MEDAKGGKECFNMVISFNLVEGASLLTSKYFAIKANYISHQ